MAGDSNFGSVSLLLPFDGPNGSTTHLDRSPVGKAITNSVGTLVSSAQSKFNGVSLSLNGVNDNLSTASHTDFNFGTGDFTIELWVYGTRTNQPHGFPRILANGAYLESGAWNLVLISSSGALFFDTYNGSAADGFSIGTLPENQWSHIAIARQSGTLRVFLNGTVATARANSQNLTGAYSTNIGSDTISFFKGYIDDLRITKGLARYTAAFTPPTEPNPIGYVTVLDPSYSSVSLLVNADGSALVDESPSPKTLTAFGNATLSKVNSRVGAGSLLFDGTGDYLTTPDASDLRIVSSDFTIEAWVYTSVNNTVKYIVRKGTSTYAAGFAFGLNPSGKVFISIGVTSTDEVFLGASTIPINTWTHVAATKSGSTVRVFVNGVVDATGTVAGAPADNAEILHIGRDPANAARDWSGYIDALRITKSVVRYTSSFTPPGYVLASFAPTPAQLGLAVLGQTPDVYTGSQPQQGSLALTGQVPELYLGLVATQASIALTGQTPRVSTGFAAQQATVNLAGQTPSVVTEITGETAEVIGRGFQTLPTILGDYDVSVVTGGTFGTVSKIYGGALVVGSPFKAIPALTALADQTGYVTGRGFSTSPSIEVSHDFVASVQGRGFSSKATVVGGSIVTGRAFSSAITATIDAPTSFSISGQGFRTQPNIVAEYQPAMRITGRGFVSGIGYSTVTGRGFTQNAVLKALETSNFAEAFVFNLAPANVEQNLYSVSRYQNYPFQHLTRIANEYYGVKADGLYRLTGEYDAAEDVLVNGTIKLNEDDLSAFSSQNIPYIYLNGDDDYTATAFVDDVEQPAFSSGFNGRRVKLARGSKGRYWYFKIEGIKSLLGVEYRPEKLARKVK